MKKRILSVMLVMAMTAGMAAGCGNSDKNTDSNAKKDNASGEKIVLNFWCHQNDAWTVSYKKMAEKFNKSQDKYEVKVTDYPFSAYSEKIQTSLTSAKDGADILAVWGGMAPDFIKTDALSEVPEDLVSELESDYMDPTLGIYKKDGKYYGVPMEYNLEYGGMIVNKKMFEEKGISYPTTWEELRKVSQEVSVSNGDLVEVKGFEMLDGDSLFCNYLAMILQQGGQYLNEDNSVNFATPEGIKAMEEILSMVDNGECDLEHLTNGDYCYNDVYQGIGYMASVGSWAISDGLESYDLTYGEDFEYAQVPMYGDKMGFASETGWGIIVPEVGEHKDGAWEFVKFFSEPENLVEHNIACAQLPPRKSLLENEKYKEELPQVEFLLEILPDGQWMGPYNTSDMRTRFNEMFIDLCQSENRDIEKALADVSKAISEECQIGYSME